MPSAIRSQKLERKRRKRRRTLRDRVAVRRRQLCTLCRKQPGTWRGQIYCEGEAGSVQFRACEACNALPEAEFLALVERRGLCPAAD